MKEFLNKFLENHEEKDKRFLLGISLIFFGLLFIVEKLGWLSSDCIIFDGRMYAVYLFLIFLYGKQVKLSAFFGVLALFFWMPEMLKNLINYLDKYLWPLVLVLIGTLIVIGGRDKRRKREAEEKLNESITELTKEKPSEEKSEVESLPESTSNHEESDHSRYFPHTDDDK